MLHIRPMTLLLLILTQSTLLQAASIQSHDPDITPETVYHRSGQLLPLQSREARPFENNRLRTCTVYFPPVQVQSAEFTAQHSRVDYTDEELISRWGRRH
ncbi:MAG: hypothetical protein OIF57_01780 [Marinobacterium sp.]|nr:hypothetical protein [Marinobacterium sp.]